MDIVGDRKFVEVPGEKTHELPPLLVRTTPKVRRLDRVVGMANNLIDAEDMMAPPALSSTWTGARWIWRSISRTSICASSRNGSGAIAFWNGSASARRPSTLA